MDYIGVGAVVIFYYLKIKSNNEFHYFQSNDSERSLIHQCFNDY